ncbi:hypothetical protein FH972_000131 [Carpinus fangiana]|uniref:Bifunctional inhibitor/plant lipid transfer protein/seed storage helical domain-containing protein n=1 Tax=Carpinus fangiana TaxID=176857 RepID=A0A5N6Q7T9_9ROSI|nr:hypothetical protein FH972_000131 [Carpinus fangiana]
MERKMVGLALGLVFLVFNACPSDGAITCPDALKSFTPCKPFLVGSGPQLLPSHECCLGAQRVFKQSAGATQTRRHLCQCLKNFAIQVGVKPERANLIPQVCKCDNPISIGPNVDCSM